MKLKLTQLRKIIREEVQRCQKRGTLRITEETMGKTAIVTMNDTGTIRVTVDDEIIDNFSAFGDDVHLDWDALFPRLEKLGVTDIDDREVSRRMPLNTYRNAVKNG